jgi:hypothetical protein
MPRIRQIGQKVKQFGHEFKGTITHDGVDGQLLLLTEDQIACVPPSHEVVAKADNLTVDGLRKALGINYMAQLVVYGELLNTYYKDEAGQAFRVELTMLAEVAGRLIASVPLEQYGNLAQSSESSQTN